MNKLTLIMACLTACLFFSCGKKKADDPMGDNGRTKRTENLLAHLSDIPRQGYLFGQQDATLYGEGWAVDSGRSDIKTICGDMPALVGFEIGGIETDDSVNIYSTPFRKIRQEIINQFDQAGVVSISWQCKKPNNEAQLGEWLDKVAEFMKSLETPYGARVPIIFRPWHDNGESKFWWSDSTCTKEQYLALWKLTRERFEKNDVVNVLYAYSPKATENTSANTYLARYPGDEYVDVLGINYYCHAEEGDTTALAAFTQTLGNNLKMLTDIGKKHHKPIALTETGYRSIKCDKWWTQYLSKAITPYPISYVMLWRNGHELTNHYYVPFPGQRSTEDFVDFYNEPKTLFLHDINGMYLNNKTEE